MKQEICLSEKEQELLGVLLSLKIERELVRKQSSSPYQKHNGYGYCLEYPCWGVSIFINKNENNKVEVWTSGYSKTKEERIIRSYYISKIRKIINNYNNGILPKKMVKVKSNFSMYVSVIDN